MRVTIDRWTTTGQSGRGALRRFKLAALSGRRVAFTRAADTINQVTFLAAAQQWWWFQGWAKWTWN